MLRAAPKGEYPECDSPSCCRPGEQGPRPSGLRRVISPNVVSLLTAPLGVGHASSQLRVIDHRGGVGEAWQGIAYQRPTDESTYCDDKHQGGRHHVAGATALPIATVS